jgi:hypothetical protein
MPAAFDGDVDVTVEVGFGSGPLADAPTWVDISTKVKAGRWRRGRSSVQNDFPAGAGTLFLDNSEGDFYPWNTSSPHSPNVTVGVPVRIQATHDSNSYPRLYGYVIRWPNRFPTDTEELAEMEMVETFAHLEGKKITTSYPEQSTNERVAALLDDVGWPATRRQLDSGVASVAALSVEAEGVLDLLRAAVEVEQGQLFQAANGDIVFLNRVAASGSASQSTFGPDGVELTYTDVTTVEDDDFLFNEALLTASTLDEVHVIDATSVDAHGPSTYEMLNEQIPSIPVALNVGEWIVGKYKDVVPRITGLTIDPAGDPDNLWPEVLGRELRDVVTVEASYPGSATQLVQAVAVESIANSFEAGGVWVVDYGCHPLSELETQDYWILGTSELEVSTRLA